MDHTSERQRAVDEVLAASMQAADEDVARLRDRVLAALDELTAAHVDIRALPREVLIGFPRDQGPAWPVVLTPQNAEAISGSSRWEVRRFIEVESSGTPARPTPPRGGAELPSAASHDAGGRADASRDVTPLPSPTATADAAPRPEEVAPEAWDLVRTSHRSGTPITVSTRYLTDAATGPVVALRADSFVVREGRVDLVAPWDQITHVRRV